MRRRRSLTSVTLAPFLSVLLCTLGALILLLLVFDLKARHAKKLEAARTSAEQSEKAEAMRAELALMELEAKWKHGAARNQIEAEAEFVRAGEAEQARLLKAKRKELAELMNRLAAEQSKAAGIKDVLANQKTHAAELDAARKAADERLAKLLAEVRSLESVVKQLEATAKIKRQVRYSLVPYKGKTGTSRQPIYLECAGRTAKFQPKGETLKLEDFLTERAFRELVEQKAMQFKESDSRPYLMVLVRPSGIPLYYAAVRALKDSDIDMGYELIGEDWAIDFEEPKELPPDFIVKHPADPKPKPGKGGPWLGNPKPEGGGNHGGNHGGGGHNGGTSGTTWPPPAIGPGIDPGRPHYQPAPTAGSPSGSGKFAVAKGGLAEFPYGKAGGSKPTEGGDEPVDPSAPESPDGPGGPGGGNALGKQRGLVSILPPKRLNRGHGPPGDGKPVANPSDHVAGGTEPPEEMKAVAKQPGDSPGPGGNHGGTGEGNKGDGNDGEGGKGVKGPQPVRPVPIGDPNREWEIVIECRQTGIEVKTLKKTFEANVLVKGDNPLTQLIRNSIEARKRGVPDLQPRVKFIIHPDGLRNYYAVADVLEPLKLPASWVVLDGKEKPEE